MGPRSPDHVGRLITAPLKHFGTMDQAEWF